MNTISALGHSALWKKYALNNAPSTAIVTAETPHSSPCASNREWLTNLTQQDTPKSIQIESLEEQSGALSSPIINLEECLKEKDEIDRVLIEREKLGPFLIESIERPLINNMTAFKESVKAIQAYNQRSSRNHLYDNIETILQNHQSYNLNRIDVIAIRLYTSSMAFVVNKALRNYSLYDIPIPTPFLPYIYALINGLIKLDSDRQINEAYGYEPDPWEVVRYIPILDSTERNEIQLILDAHQPGAYVMYPSFTSTSIGDQARTLWSDGFQARFQIKAKTAISIEDLAINHNEYEAVFLPGTIFRILERDDPYFVMEEIIPRKLYERRAQLPC